MTEQTSGQDRFAALRHAYGGPQRKLDRCYNTAYRKFTDFLDDSERVAAYNDHVQKIAADYPAVAAFAPFFMMDPAKTACFKSQTVHTEIDDRPLERYNAECLSKIVDKGDHRVQELTVSYGSVALDEDSDLEAELKIIHELTHGYHSFHKRFAPIFLLNEDEQKQLRHFEELTCDAGANSVIPWPRYGDVRVKNSIESSFNIAGNAQKCLDTIPARREAGEDPEVLTEIETTMQTLVKEYGYPTISKIDSIDHPSDKKFYDNSNLLAETLAPGRVDAYLDCLYGGHAPQPEIAWRTQAKDAKADAPAAAGLQDFQLNSPVPLRDEMPVKGDVSPVGSTPRNKSGMR